MHIILTLLDYRRHFLLSFLILGWNGSQICCMFFFILLITFNFMHPQKQTFCLWFLLLVVIGCLMQHVCFQRLVLETCPGWEWSLYLCMDWCGLCGQILTVSDSMTASLGCSGISDVFSSLSNSSWCLLFLFSFFFSFLSFSGSSRSSLSWDLECSFFGKRGSKANLSDEREKRRTQIIERRLCFIG